MGEVKPEQLGEARTPAALKRPQTRLERLKSPNAVWGRSRLDSQGHALRHAHDVVYGAGKKAAL